jgi:hypothetical protein
MNYVPPPPRVPFNDTLYQALDPLKQALSDKARIEMIMQKYGRPNPAKNPPPQRQWEGDPNA